MSDPYIKIVRELLASEDEFISGNELAEIIGVSRVSVWSYMEKLKQQGYDFEAVRSKGYRLTKTPEALNEILVQARLAFAASEIKAIVMEEVDSTNSEAERRLANGQETPFVVLASKQTSGRGRLGRAWHSPQNGNVYASYAFRPQISPTQMSLFTLWMGINLCECINALSKLQCKVKWPNDLLVKGKKVAGILTEARMETDQVRDIVLGIGLNINSEGIDWPENLQASATTLRKEAGQVFEVNKFVSAISGRIAIAYKQFIDGRHRDLLKEKWPLYDMLKGKTVTLLQGQSRISGIASGIDASGSLLIQRDDGSRYLARAGEVTLEKQDYSNGF